ncbi:HEPN domain-containing protein [Acetobacter sp. P5B1]|uniref:HEPN domain-containing protein n=1 Tax=Acetobacter sp. P5B1 TaxID=2762620 RepID=UPI001C04F7A2|nr:HEPN domain-containing protein [Acetobacter sp. P5B1]
MPVLKEEIEEDIRFILSERNRFARMEQQWASTKRCPEELQQAFLWEIQHPIDKANKLIVGREAVVRLEGLARTALRNAGIARQVDDLAIKMPLGMILFRRFVIEKKPINTRNIDRALSEAAKLARRSLQTRTHFIPCHLMLATEPAEFSIGPVRFMNQKSFRSRIADQVWGDRKSYRGDSYLRRDTAKYYGNFNWVAEVTIPCCDKRISERVATDTVTSALDCLAILFSASHSARMSVGGPAVKHDRRATLQLLNGTLSFSTSFAWSGEVTFPNDWAAVFERPDYRYILNLFGVALETAIDPRLCRPLSERFLDSALWFGEAVRERSPAARVIKYVTALERLVMTDEKNDITFQVATRVSAICFDPDDPESLGQLRQEAQRAYSLRSKLVHGSLSPKSDEVMDGVRLGAKLCELALINTLAIFGVQGLRADKLTRSEIISCFQRVVEQANRDGRGDLF